MDTELFPESTISVDSPRLKWLKKHNLAIGVLPDGKKFCVGIEAAGFGTSRPEDYQTLCIPCHKSETRSLQCRRAETRKAGDTLALPL